MTIVGRKEGPSRKAEDGFGSQTGFGTLTAIEEQVDEPQYVSLSLSHLDSGLVQQTALCLDPPTSLLAFSHVPPLPVSVCFCVPRPAPEIPLPAIALGLRSHSAHTPTELGVPGN